MALIFVVVEAKVDSGYVWVHARVSTKMHTLQAALEECVRLYGSETGPLLHQVVMDLTYLKKWETVTIHQVYPCIIARQYPEVC